MADWDEDDWKKNDWKADDWRKHGDPLKHKEWADHGNWRWFKLTIGSLYLL